MDFKKVIDVIEKLSHKSMTTSEIVEFLGYKPNNYSAFEKLKGILGNTLIKVDGIMRPIYYSINEADEAKRCAIKALGVKSKAPEESERRLKPLSGDSKSKLILSLIDLVYKSNAGLSVEDIKVATNHKISRDLIIREFSFLVKEYPDFVIKSGEKYVIKDYRGLMKSLYPEKEFIHLVIAVDESGDVSSKQLGLSNSNIEKTERFGKIFYEISVPNSKSLWETLAKLKVFHNMVIISPSRLNEALEEEISKAISNSDVILR